MELATIKELLKANCEGVRGKELQVNGVVYPTLKEFGLAIIELSKERRIWSLELCINNHAMNFNNVRSINHTFTRPFTTVKVFADSILEHNHIKPSEQAIMNFGTNV